MPTKIDKDDDHELVRADIVDEIVGSCGCSFLIDGLAHGTFQIKTAAARIIATISGTSVGAGALLEETVLRTKRNHRPDRPDSSVFKLLLGVASSDNEEVTIRVNCLRGLLHIATAARAEEGEKRMCLIAMVDAVAENALHDKTATPEIRALCDRLRSTLDEVANPPAAYKIPHSNNEDILNFQSKCDDIGRSNFIYKLQILYGTNLQAADTTTVFSSALRTRTLDPYVVVCCEGCQLVRSAVTPKSTTPLFRSLCSNMEDNTVYVEIPNEVAFAHADSAENLGLFIRLYDYDTVGTDTFLGEVRLSPFDLKQATGRRLIKPLQPIEHKFVGGEVHVAGHLIPGQPHIVVHILEAYHLENSRAGAEQQHSTRLHSVATRSGGSGISGPFVICYVDGNELFRSDIALNGDYPCWQHRAQSTILQLCLSPTTAAKTYRGCPELRFDLFGAAGPGDHVRQRTFLGQATLSGSEELRPSLLHDNQDCHVLRLSHKDAQNLAGATEHDNGTLKVRLELREAISSTNDWLDNGSQPQCASPDMLDVYILGAKNVNARSVHVRVWFNGKQLRQLTSTACMSGCDPTWEDDDTLSATTGHFLLALERCGRYNDKLLIELWGLPAAQGGSERKVVGHPVCIGRLRIKEEMLHSPPSHRIDLPLRPRLGWTGMVQSYIRGSLSIFLSPRVVGINGVGLTVGNSGGFNCAKSLLLKGGESPRKLILMHVISAYRISHVSKTVQRATVEVIYNRRSVALIDSTTQGRTVKGDRAIPSIFWDSLTELPASDIFFHGHDAVWPEMQLKLWGSPQKGGQRNSLLGVAYLAGGMVARRENTHEMNLPVIPQNYFSDLEVRILGHIGLSMCVIAEQEFLHEVACWGINSFACSMLAVQIQGMSGGYHTDDASANVSWGGVCVGKTESRSADQNLRCSWKNSDFLLPMDLPSGSRVLRITIQANTSKKPLEPPHLISSLAVVVNLKDSTLIPPFGATYTLHPISDKFATNCCDGSSLPTQSADDFWSNHDQSQLSEVFLRLHEHKPVSSFPSSTTSAFRESRSRLRISILGVSGIANCRGLSKARKLANKTGFFSIMICYENKGVLQTLQLVPAFPESDIGTSTAIFPVEEEVIVWLPSTWHLDWALGRGALWVELRYANSLLGIAFMGSTSLATIPLHVNETHFSYLELRNQAIPDTQFTTKSVLSKRVLQPETGKRKYDFRVRFPPFRVLGVRLHQRLLMERLHLSKGCDLIAASPPGQLVTVLPKRTFLPQHAGDDIVSRLRLFIVGFTRLLCHGHEEAVSKLDVVWSGRSIGCCRPTYASSLLGTQALLGKLLFLLPFACGTAGATRADDVLLLTIRHSSVTSHPTESIVLSWNDFQRLDRAQTDYLTCLKSLRSALNLSELLATPPIEMEFCGICDGHPIAMSMHNNCCTAMSRAGKCAVTLHLIVEESRASVPHLLSMQLNGVASLQDPRNPNTCQRKSTCSAEKARWSGSVQRWPYVSIFGPRLLGEYVRGRACAHQKWRGSTPWNSLQVTHYKLTQQLFIKIPAIRWVQTATFPSHSTTIMLVEFGERGIDDWSYVTHLQAWYRQLLVKWFTAAAKLAGSAREVDRHALQILRRFFLLLRNGILVKHHPENSPATKLQGVWGKVSARRTYPFQPPESLVRFLVEPTRAISDVQVGREAIVIFKALGCNILGTLNVLKRDPFVIITINGALVGRTPAQCRALHPNWRDRDYTLPPIGRPDNKAHGIMALESLIGIASMDTDSRRLNKSGPSGQAPAQLLLVCMMLILQPQDRCQLLQMALAPICRFYDSNKATPPCGFWGVFLVARIGDRSICSEKYPLLEALSQNRAKRGHISYADVMTLKFKCPSHPTFSHLTTADKNWKLAEIATLISTATLELEIWGQQENSATCLGNSCTTISAPYKKINFLQLTLKKTSDVCRNLRKELFVANTTLSIAIQTRISKLESDPVCQLYPMPERHPPSFFLHFTGVSLFRCRIRDGFILDHCQPQPNSISRSLDVYMSYRLGMSSHRSSTLTCVDGSATWPVDEVITLGDWHLLDDSQLQLDLFCDNAPCFDDHLGSQTAKLSNYDGSWQHHSIALRGGNHYFVINVSFWVVLTRQRAPVPPKLEPRDYSISVQAVFDSVLLGSSRTPRAKDRRVAHNGYELKVYSMVATSLPETDYWAAFCGNTRDPFIVVSMLGKFSRTSITKGKGVHCDWDNEALTLLINHIPNLACTCPSRAGGACSSNAPQTALNAELIVQLWNDNSPKNNVLIGEARTNLGKYFYDNLGTEHTLELSLTRPPVGQTGLNRAQGTLSFSMVVNLAQDFFYDEVQVGHRGIKVTMPQNELRVAVIQARFLTKKGNESQQLGTLGAQVSLNCSGECASSSIKHNLLFPVWNEPFSLRVCAGHKIVAPKLEVALDAWDGCSKSRRIGCVAIPLAPLQDGAVRRKWYHLSTSPDTISSRTSITEINGSAQTANARLNNTKVELELALHWKHRPVLILYNPSLDVFGLHEEPSAYCAQAPNELFIALIRARGLQAPKEGYFSPSVDPFARFVFNDEERQSKVIHRNLNPEWNESFRVPCDSSEMSMSVMIFDWDLGNISHVLGMASISLRRLHDRKPSRRWYQLSTTSREEIEIALRWIHNPELVLFDDELNTKARVCNRKSKMRPNCIQVILTRAKGLGATSLSGTGNLSAVISLHAHPRKNRCIEHLEKQEKKLKQEVLHRITCVTSRVEYNNPSWSKAISFPCMSTSVKDDVGWGFDTPTLCVETVHTCRGVALILGAAYVDLDGICDDAHRRFWISLDDRTVAQEYELALRWTYNSKLDPEVYLRISHLRVSNISSSILSVSERVHLRFTLSGYAADTPTARIVLDDGYVIWTEDLKILATAQTLVEKRVHVCLFLEMISVAVTETLVGCVYLWCPHNIAYHPESMLPSSIPGEYCIQACLRHGSLNHPMAHLEFLMNLDQWSPDMASSLESPRVPQIHFDVFHDNDDLLGPHIGRAVIDDSQLRNVTTIYPYDSHLTALIASRLSLRPWTYEGADTSMRGTHVLPAGSADARAVPSRKLRPPGGRHCQTLQKLGDVLSQESINIVRALLKTTVETAWNFSCFGRHQRLHVMLTAERDELTASYERYIKLPMQEGISHGPHGDEESTARRCAHCRVDWNETEVELMAIDTHARPWYASILLSPTSLEARNATSRKGCALSLHVQDPSDEKNGIEASFRGGVSLSHMELWELRQVTLHGLRRGNIHFEAISCLDVKAEYSLRNSLSEHEGVTENDAGGCRGMTPRSVSLCMSNIAAAELPDTIFSSRLFGGLFPARESLYVVVQMCDKEQHSSTAKRIGVTLIIEESYFREEPLVMQLWSRGTSSLSSYMVGEARIQLDLVGIQLRTIPTTFDLGRPGYRQQGVLSCTISVEHSKMPAESCFTDIASNVPLNSSNKMGIIGLAVTINHDAEAATNAVACVQHAKTECSVLMQDQYENVTAGAAMDCAHFYRAPASTIAVDGATQHGSHPNIHFDRFQYVQDKPRCGGLDPVTGLPWRMDRLGYRRFYLGHFKMD